jgi:hypothetical protein
VALTLGPTPLKDIAKRILWFPALCLVLSIVAVFVTHKSGWLSVGGGVVTAYGTLFWARRLARNPTGSDPEVPPMAIPDPQGRGPGLLLHGPGINARSEQARDNWAAYLGVWLTIIGAIVGSAGPFLADTFWLSHWPCGTVHCGVWHGRGFAMMRPDSLQNGSVFSESRVPP